MENQVRAELQKKDFTSAELDNASRSLKRMADVSVDDQMIHLFCALKRVKGQGARLNASILSQWQARSVQSTTVKSTYWVVPNTAPELAHPDIQQHIVDPEDLPEVPSGLLQQGICFVDQVVDRSKLGKHVSTIELALGVQRFSSPDPLDATVAAFWFRAYSKHILRKYETSKKAPDDFLKSLDPCTSLCIKFTVKSLLAHKALEELAFFTEPLKQLKERLPSFLPELAEALLHMEGSLKSVDKVSFEHLDLSQQRLLYRSVLYQQFVAARAHEDLQREMKRVRAGGTFEPERIQSMLNGPATEQDKANMRFGLDWFTSMAKEDRVKLLSTHGLRQPKFRFIMAKPENFERLAQWLDEGATDSDVAIMELQPLTVKTATLEDLDPQKVLRMALLVAKEVNCINTVVHPLFRSLLKDFQKVLHAAGDSDLRVELAKACFMEACSQKAGIKGVIIHFSTEALAAEEHKDAIQNMSKLLPQSSSVSEHGPAHKFLCEVVRVAKM
ncbi:unnamed protein product [Symbiodinium necroappetens]|uniref:Uncharacterized protein n=1 Tax=Symbiodinium necroappetens TaxID=1628268 RepID=A0A812YE32_9DINO|nr:unnamed protein product [Symbiodinium necroappetens]